MSDDPLEEVQVRIYLPGYSVWIAMEGDHVWLLDGDVEDDEWELVEDAVATETKKGYRRFFGARR